MPANPEEKRERKNDNLVFVICLIIASIFWLLIKLSAVYNESYSFRVSYYNVPEGKNLSKIIDSTLNVKIRAKGFTILRLNLFEDMNNLTINLKNAGLIANEGNYYQISTEGLREKIGEAIGISPGDVVISRPVLRFVMEDLAEKTVPVTPELSLEFRKTYDLYEPPVVSPGKIKVYGPPSILDTLKGLRTQRVVLKDVYADRKIDVGLQNPAPGQLQFDPEIVTVSFRVEKFTESSVEIPIDLSKVRLKIKTFPAIVKVNFKVAQKDYNNVQPNHFNVVPETAGIDLHKVQELHLFLEKKPDFIRNVWLNPTDVEFLIIK